MIHQSDIYELLYDQIGKYQAIVVVFHKGFHFKSVAQTIEQKGIKVGYHIDSSQTTINVEKQQVHLVTYSLLAPLLHTGQKVSYDLVILESFSQPSVWKELLLLDLPSLKTSTMFHIHPNAKFLASPWNAHKAYKLSLPDDDNASAVKDVWSSNERLTDIAAKALANGRVWIVTNQRATSMKFEPIFENIEGAIVCNLDAKHNDSDALTRATVILGTIQHINRIPTVNSIIDMGYSHTKLFDTSTVCQEMSVRPISKETILLLKSILKAGDTIYHTYTEKQYSIMKEQDISPLEQNDTSSHLFQYCRFWGKDIVPLNKILHPPTPDTLSVLFKKFEHLKLANSTGDLTEYGTQCSLLNIEPEYAIMAIESVALKCSEDICALIAILRFDPTLRKYGMNATEMNPMDLINAYVNQTFNEISQRNINSMKNRLLRKLGLDTSTSQPFNQENILSCIKKGLHFNQFRVEGGHVKIPSINKIIDLGKTSIGKISPKNGTSGYFTTVLKTGTFYHFNVFFFL